MAMIEIKAVTASDVSLLQQIGKQTFYETFSASNTQANMAEYLEKVFLPENIRMELENPESEFYFACLDSEAIGYLKVNVGNAQTELKEKDALEIERIYVLEQYHGKKVGQALYEKAVQLALGKRVKYIWLGVWEENIRAIQFYQKNGFVEFDKHIFKLGNDEQTDLLMKKMLP